MGGRSIEDLRVVFMGTPDFAVASLDTLVNSGVNIVGVITAPDRPAGRGYKLKHSPVKRYAVEKGLKVLQPTNLKSDDFVNELRSLKADLQVVVAFRMLPEVVWDMPPEGTFNLHASLLPQYRGAAPINWAVINGEKVSGVTTFFLDKKIDTGAIIDQVKVPVAEDMTAGDLHDVLMVTGSELVLKTVMDIAKGKVSTIDQDKIDVGGSLKPAPKLNRENCRIDWTLEMEDVYNFVRGLSPYPGAWSRIKVEGIENQLNLKVLKANKIEDSQLAPGHLSTDNKHLIYIGTKNGAIEVKELQLEGKRRMKVDELLRGTTIIDNQKLD